MAKQNKSRKISRSDKYWYRLGFMNGENQLEQRTLKQLRRVNNLLWEEITRLDRNKSVVGVLLPYETMTRVITGLSANGGDRRHQHLIKRLKAMIREAHKDDDHNALMSLEKEVVGN